MTMNIYGKLSEIQNELKAPKNQRNTFGNYNYRNCEDILEATKPLCKKHKTTLIISDDIEVIGDRHYIKATCTLFDCESEASISNSALARESLIKKGMDDSQITGTASSYARKYALNGLFNIDDTKDGDSNETSKLNDDEITKLSINYTELRSKMTQLKIDFRSSKVEEWLFVKAKVSTQDATQLNKEELTQLNKAYRSLIKGKEAENIDEINKKTCDEHGVF